MSWIENTHVLPVIGRSPHSLVYPATLRDYILCFCFSQSINQSQILKKGISCHSGINVQIFVMKNYSGIPKFKTIDHSKHKLDFYNWSYFGYCQNKCTFSDHSWLFFFFLMSVENRERDRKSNRRPQRDRRAPNYTLGGAACRDLVKNRWVDMGLCLSACFSFPLKPLLWSTQAVYSKRSGLAVGVYSNSLDIWTDYLLTFTV